MEYDGIVKSQRTHVYIIWNWYYLLIHFKRHFWGNSRVNLGILKVRKVEEQETYNLAYIYHHSDCIRVFTLLTTPRGVFVDMNNDEANS